MSEIIERASELELQSVGYAMRHLAWCGVCEDVFAKVQFTNLMPESGETTRAMETERNPSAFALSRDVSYMKLDGEAVKCLHILTGDTGKLTGSLFEFLNQTLTPSGRRRLRQWLVKPLREVEVIQARLDVVEEFSQHTCCRPYDFDLVYREKKLQQGKLFHMVLDYNADTLQVEKQLEDFRLALPFLQILKVIHQVQICFLFSQYLMKSQIQKNNIYLFLTNAYLSIF